jgi:predicted N-acetyltransferase YhbS
VSGVSERSEPVLRAATPADDEGVAACIGAAFPDNPKSRLDVLQWQYRANPFGPSPTWVWEDDGRIVAHYTAYPVPYLLDGARTRAGFAVDAAVVPSHQGRGLFTPLARALYDDCASKGMPLAVCYASNPIAMRGVAAAGVHWFPRLRTLVLAVDDAWLGRRFHLPTAVAGLVRRAAFRPGSGPDGIEIDGPPDGIGALWERTVAAGGIRNGVDRGGAWWQWRYAASPLGPYRYFELRRGDALAAAAVVSSREDFGGRFGYLLELLADDAAAARAVLRAAAGRLVGISGLATIAVDRGPLHRIATAAGMRTLPRRLEPKGAWYGCVDTTERSAPLDGSWHIGWGDLDHL